jgi:cation diffusion facilitator family transporter
MERMRGSTGATRKTVLIALFANAAVCIVKLAGGLMAASSAMLAEAAHSLADTTNQAFLLVSIGLSDREPTPDQPFGYGQARFLWTFMAAVGMFVAGAIFAVGYGVYALLHPKEESALIIAYVTLLIAFVAEGTSWVRAVRQTKREASELDKPTLRYARESRDPNVKMVLFEDTAALVGILIAFVGITIDAVTGSKVFDPAASIGIGLLLVGVAVWLGRDVSHLLIGASARPEERETIDETIREFDEVDEIVELLTLVLGPNALLVAARIDLADDVDAERVEDVSSEIDDRIRERVPDVTEVFLDATSAHSRA